MSCLGHTCVLTKTFQGKLLGLCKPQPSMTETSVELSNKGIHF